MNKIEERRKLQKKNREWAVAFLSIHDALQGMKQFRINIQLYEIMQTYHA